MKIYECPNKCTVSDKDGRCNRCGELLRFMGNDTQERVMKHVQDRQRDAVGSSKNPFLNTSYNKELCDKLRRQEKIIKSK